MTQPKQHHKEWRWTAGLWTAIVVVLLGFWGFFQLANYASSDEVHGIDEAILLSMRSPSDADNPIGPRWLEELGRDFTALGGTGVLTLASLIVVTYLLLTGRRHTAVTIVVSITSGIIVSTLLKEFFDRPRPDLVAHGSHTYTSSFPSGHSMMSAVCYLTLAGLLCTVERSRKIRLYLIGTALFLTALVGTSRVYLGVHWPSDVLAGWLTGAAWAALSLWIAHFIYASKQRRDPERDSSKRSGTLENAKNNT